MDAKRIIPELQIPGEGAQEPAGWASRLELEGADGILFRQREPGVSAGWIREVAGALAVPFALEAPFRDWAELERVLEAGVDQVVLAGAAAAVDPLLAAAVRACGRSRVAVAVRAIPAGKAWRVELDDEIRGRDALAWMAELEQRGAGEILLQAEPGAEGLAALLQGAARLALSVLFRAPGTEAVLAEALLHGADGVAYPAGARSPRQWKAALGARGLVLRP